MTDKERLVELLKQNCHCKDEDCAKCSSKGFCFTHREADYILADGWIRPPCKVGQTVYIIHQEKIISGIVRLIRPFISKNEIIYKGNVACMINIFSKDIKEPHEFFVVFEKPCGIEQIAYLTREEAEKALRGGGEE